MGAFANDDEGSLFLFLAELQVSEHVAQFLLPASHSERTHPVAGLPETHSERESQIDGSDSFGLFRILNLSDFHLQADTPDNILSRSRIDGPRGYVLVAHGGAVLGFANNLGNRANNLYPKPQRILSTHLPTTKPDVL